MLCCVVVWCGVVWLNDTRFPKRCYCGLLHTCVWMPCFYWQENQIKEVKEAAISINWGGGVSIACLSGSNSSLWPLRTMLCFTKHTSTFRLLLWQSTFKVSFHYQPCSYSHMLAKLATLLIPIYFPSNPCGGGA